MAESFMGNGDNTLKDDIIKQTLQAELTELKASSELMNKTLNLCREEMAQDKKHSKVQVMNRMVLRYGGTLAACLLIAVLAFSMTMNREKSATQAPNSVAMDSAAPAASYEAGEPEMLAKSVADGRGVGNEAAMEMAPEPAPAMPRMEEDVNAGIAAVTYGGPTVLQSLTFGQPISVSKAKLSTQAVDALVTDYNQKNGLNFTVNASDAFYVNSLVVGGVTSEKLSVATSYKDILGDQAYWMLPLKDQQNNLANMLPVFTKADKGEENASTDLDIAFSENLSTWATSSYYYLQVNQELVGFVQNYGSLDILPDKEGEMVTDIQIADINGGMDYIVFLQVDGREYGIPFFTTFEVDSLNNGKAYEIMEMFSKLSKFLTPDAQ